MEASAAIALGTALCLSIVLGVAALTYWARRGPSGRAWCGAAAGTAPRRSSLAARLELGPVYPGCEPTAADSAGAVPLVPGHAARVRRVHALLAADRPVHLGVEDVLVQPTTPAAPQAGTLATEFDTARRGSRGAPPAPPSGFTAELWELEVPMGGLGCDVGLILAADPSGCRAFVSRLCPGGLAYRAHGAIAAGDVIVGVNDRRCSAGAAAGGGGCPGPVAAAKGTLLAALRAASVCGGTVRVAVHRPGGTALPRGPAPPSVA